MQKFGRLDVESLSYRQLTHIHSGADTLSYRYDRQGNLLEEQGKANRKQYRYDTANRQVGIVSTKTDGITEKLCQTNRYDGEGLRYETEENGKVIRFLFGRGELAQENDGETSYIRGYRHSPVLLNRNGEESNYFVQDEMGSTLFLLDHNNEIRKTYHYDAFGNILKETGDTPNHLTYTGQIYDGAAVQYYYRARFYNPAIGRFMQEDTYRGDGLNLYAYCANNPVMHYDPSGNLLCPNGKTAPANDGGNEGGNEGGSDADLTIMSRNSSRGNPRAITYFDVEINTRQKNILQQLPNCDSSIIVNKGDVRLNDLAALTAVTGDEFAMFI